jgi:riboflavin biosynthesis pyrimidine reductase
VIGAGDGGGGSGLRRLHPGPPGDVEDLADAYPREAPAPGRPVQVRANFVTSLDGGVEVRGRSGPLSSPADRSIFGVLRSLADVVLVGAGTVRSEHYGPVRADPDRQARRRARGLGPGPPIAVVSASLALDLEAPFFTKATTRPILLTTHDAPVDRRRAAAEVAEVLEVGGRSVDLGEGLALLGERGLVQVLCEGGPTLLGHLAGAGQLDELCLTLAPTLTGGANVLHLLGTPGTGDWPVDLDLVQVLSDDANLFLRYRRG